MSETTSISNWQSRLSSVALILMMSSTSPSIATLDNTSPTLVRGSMISVVTASRSQHLPGEARTWQEIRAMKIKLLRGKYRDALTPSDQFARQKIEEIALEG